MFGELAVINFPPIRLLSPLITSPFLLGSQRHRFCDLGYVFLSTMTNGTLFVCRLRTFIYSNARRQSLLSVQSLRSRNQAHVVVHNRIQRCEERRIFCLDVWEGRQKGELSALSGTVDQYCRWHLQQIESPSNV